MRKLILLIAALALVAMPSTADAAKKKKRVAAKPKATTERQMLPGEPGARVIGGFFREVGKIGQPVAPPQQVRQAGKPKKAKKARRA